MGIHVVCLVDPGLICRQQTLLSEISTVSVSSYPGVALYTALCVTISHSIHYPFSWLIHSASLNILCFKAWMLSLLRLSGLLSTFRPVVHRALVLCMVRHVD